LDCITNSYRKQKYSMKNTIRSTGASLSSWNKEAKWFEIFDLKILKLSFKIDISTQR
jgi:hypothetical protein